MRVALAILTVLTLLLNGYHPLAEDGGLYVAGVQLTLNPSLFPHYTVFVSEHLHYSIFAPVLAFFVHLTHLSLDWILLLTNLVSLWLTFYAAHRILKRTIANDAAQLAGLCLLAAFWTLPIAGTSLLLMDPYVTARSLSTPLSLLAVAFALDHSSALRPILLSALCLILAAAFHPLMAAYAFAFVLILRLTRLRQRNLAYAILTLAALALAAILQSAAPNESPAVVAAEITRYYWFLSQWQWFELLGLIGPLAVLAALLLRYRKHPSSRNDAAATLCRASIALGCIATLVALLFAHESSRTHLVARMQPLRVFLLIYAIMTILLGATLTEIALEARRRLHPRPLRATLTALPAILILALAATMFYVQRQTFPASEHLELPWLAQRNPNPWVRAFLWARDNTPPDALFALDTKYVNEDGEDAQTFRPIALRSALPDFSKDGGEAAITPALATQWQQGAAAQRDLSTETDTVRDARLLPLGVTWMVLHAAAPTIHDCPYNNGSIKVCSLLPSLH
jgi:MFS family permease